MHTMEEIKKRAITEALEITGGNIEQAARNLQISRATIHRLIRLGKIEQPVRRRSPAATH